MVTTYKRLNHIWYNKSFFGYLNITGLENRNTNHKILHTYKVLNVNTTMALPEVNIKNGKSTIRQEKYKTSIFCNVKGEVYLLQYDF